MSGITKKSFDQPDEVRNPPMGRIDVVTPPRWAQPRDQTW
jgi:hypothetical protein